MLKSVSFLFGQKRIKKPIIRNRKQTLKISQKTAKLQPDQVFKFKIMNKI
ncbi:hypothetical protein M2347_000913 [Chryseobacterium sp. H1D6B]|nr:hypothetical protein [Chryseobacterium sp. H1D6B]